MTDLKIQEEREAYAKWSADYFYKNNKWPNCETEASYWLSRMSFLESRLREEIAQSIEERKVDERMEEREGEERDLLIRIFGEAKTPEYMAERRYGFNRTIELSANLARNSEQK